MHTEGNMNKPLIGLIGGVIIDQGGLFPGYERSYVNSDYVKAVVEAGGVPVILPPITDQEAIRKQLACVDAIIITGGIDVNPLVYGEEPMDKLGQIQTLRDEFDLAVIKEVLELKKPVLGICRGLQILNVAFGGTLYQDLSYSEDSYIKHVQNTAPHVPGHTVDIVEGTRLFGLLGAKTTTNSFHHQAIKDLGKGLKVSARAKDGIIEGIEREEGYVVAVQWHPEMMASKHKEMRKIFADLIREANK